MTSLSKLERPLHFAAQSICKLELFQTSPTRRNTIGTGFIWRYSDAVFLVTVLHNLTGKNVFTGECDFTPQLIQAEVPMRMGKSGQGIGSYEFRPVTDEGEKRWGQVADNIDVAAIKLIQKGDWGYSLMTCLNDYAFQENLFVEPGSDCIVAGYPESFQFTAKTPLFKRASIASQPELDYRDLPYFLVDTLGNKGMSGSPVYARHSGLLLTDPPEEKNRGHIGVYERFLGIYSGREGHEGLGFQLGRVTKTHAVEQAVLLANASEPVRGFIPTEKPLPAPWDQ